MPNSPNDEFPGQVFGEASRILGDLMDELVPPEAQQHLKNAERELLLALAITVAHHANRAHRPTSGDDPPQQHHPTKVQISD